MNNEKTLSELRAEAKNKSLSDEIRAEAKATLRRKIRQTLRRNRTSRIGSWLL